MKQVCSIHSATLFAAMTATLALAPTSSAAAGLQKTVLVTDCENPMQVEEIGRAHV